MCFCFQCLNVLVQHGTAPDYYDERKEANGKLYGCTCPKGDPNARVCLYVSSFLFRELSQHIIIHFIMP